MILAPPATTHPRPAAQDHTVEAAWQTLRAASTDRRTAIRACAEMIARCRDERRVIAAAILATMKGH